MEITVSTTVNASKEKAWDYWTKPEHICNWNFATEDWECPQARNDLRPGGDFSYRMAAKDGSMAFDYSGKYSRIEENSLIEFILDDGRKVSISFSVVDGSVLVEERFEAEAQNDPELQRSGWQAILNNFKKYTESF